MNIMKLKAGSRIQYRKVGVARLVEPSRLGVLNNEHGHGQWVVRFETGPHRNKGLRTLWLTPVVCSEV